MKLNELPNISKVIENKLIRVGITCPEQLKQEGSKAAFVKLRISDSGSCLSMLYALEGAIRDIRWHHLDSITKKELKDFYDSITFRPFKKAKAC